MLMGSKERNISWDEYKEMYRQLMRSSYQQNRKIWDDVLSREEVTLVCFCKTEDNCHRYLLADYFSKLGSEYIGELEI